jgi:uncharacterized coiled-coil protein SlyX
MGIGGLSMKSNFQIMTLRELKKYVLEHRNDQTAFQALMDRVDSQAKNQIYEEVDIQQFSILVDQHIHSQTSS